MKRILLLILLTAFSLVGCAQQPSGIIDATQFKKLIEEKKDVQLIDVRTPNEFKAGHIQGAINIDFYRGDFKEAIAKLDKSKPIAIYCAVGGRSGASTEVAAQLGFKQVYDLQGGISVWQRKGLPIVKD
jgi:rhodanese-related sulfurtransferase